MLETIINFMLDIFSSVLQMNLRDHHEIPFALPLVTASFTGFTIGFVILRMIGNEERERNENLDREPLE